MPVVLLSLLVAMAGPSLGASPPPAPAGASASDPATDPAIDRAIDPRWLERLDKLDRTFLDELIGSAPPAFAPDLTWVDAERRTWADLRGRVVVIQSWTSRTAAGRKAPDLLARRLAEFSAGDVEIILLHTPEGRDGVQRFLDQRPLERAVVVDPSGAFCDALGVYQRPVNIVIDRNGVTRYAGLNARGLAPAVAGLIAEAHDPDAAPAPAAPTATGVFPPFAGTIDRAIDFRGKTAPAFTVERWWTEKPDAAGKVVVLDFWATWCGPCIAAIPHMNDLAGRFRDDVCVIGISREEASKFDAGMTRVRGRHEIRYALALDSGGTMQSAIGIRAIPHCIVISRDWTVRWQGHPARLTPEIVEQIVQADAGADPRRLRWTRR